MENNIPKDENYTGEGRVNAPKNEDKPHKVEIEINKFQNLVKALNDPRMLAKIIMVTCIIVFLLFLGISLIAMMLKKFYPYNVISTNEYGATFIQNEDKDVIYWLFNSADLWANSGVEVKKGDIVTIHTSGAFHTAIHHLADDADSNRIQYNWMEADGGKPSKIPHDDKRAEYRIIPQYSHNTILMQVIPTKYFVGNIGEWWRNENRKDDSESFDDRVDGKSAHIYVIGMGRDNIEIQEDGYLCFAVNDIVLTQRNIKEMMKEVSIDSNECKDTGNLEMGNYPIPQDSIELTDLKSHIKEFEKEDNGLIRLINEAIKDTTKIKDNIAFKQEINKTVTELDYYYIHNYINAWYDDNVGSFLVAIERKK
ncbi:MAG: hypothetical protein J5542_06460 [Bacteroidales bacterium]|nr:hypothetical protein [Bacteroidales bacterium]